MATAGGRQEEEVAMIKEQFPGRCRVLAQVGEHTHSVTLQPQDRDATIKFLLKASYPDSAPQVAVRSGLGEGVARQLELVLEKEAQTRLGRPMLAELLGLAETWLSEAGFEPTTPASPGKKGGDKGKKKKAKKGKKKPHDEAEDGDSKLPSMRTADDVIKRIQWDDNLDKDDFVVGYIDRFKGLQEKYFSAFSWEDLASVDYNVLAVPRHRIQYFKYRGVVVWDKPSRLDLVFGSTGSKVTITDVIENYEDFAQRQAASGVGAAGAVAGAVAYAIPAASASAATGYGNSGRRDYDDDDDDSDDDSDDGINVTIALNTQASAARAEEVTRPTSYVLVREDRQWPTHFLSVRITDEETVRAVKTMQDFIVEREPLYDECVMPPATLHMTLCTLGLDTPQHVEVATKLLQDLAEDWRSHRPRKPMVFHGVSHFNRQVLYAKVNDNPELMDFVNHVMMSVRSAGLEIRDSYKFVPHMTIMKVSSPVAKKKQSKEVDPRLYEKFLDRHFGSQTLDTVLLCSMGGERGKDGFYVRQSQINLTA